jgi:hypothetical protein
MPWNTTSRGGHYLRWRILARIRRFFRPTLRRPLRFFIGTPDLSRVRATYCMQP